MKKVTNNRVFPLGDNAITNAIYRNMILFNIQKDSITNSSILLMVDGDKYEVRDIKEKISDNKKIIYFKYKVISNSNKTHPLFFLTAFFDTYYITLERFLIKDLFMILGDILGFEGCSYPSIKAKYARSELFDAGSMNRIPMQYPYLMEYTKSLIKDYLHNAKNGLWTIKCINIATAFINSADKNNYKKFMEAFNSEFLWRCGYRTLRELIEDLTSLGFDKSLLAALYDMEGEYQCLEALTLPTANALNKKDMPQVKRTVSDCLDVLERLDKKGKLYYEQF